MQNDLKSKLESGDKKISVRTMYRSTKLSTRFNLKDETKPEDIHNVQFVRVQIVQIDVLRRNPTKIGKTDTRAPRKRSKVPCKDTHGTYKTQKGE